MMFWISVLLLSFLIFTPVSATMCFNCISKEIRTSYHKYTESLPDSQWQFPMGKYDCAYYQQINCDGECVGYKVEATIKGIAKTGYVYGCVNTLMMQQLSTLKPVSVGKRECVTNNHRYSYSHSAEITVCRCNDHLCNDPANNFFGPNYTPLSRPAESAAISAPSGFGVGSATNSAPSLIFTTSTTSATTTATVIHDLMIILPHLILTYVILHF